MRHAPEDIVVLYEQVVDVQGFEVFPTWATLDETAALFLDHSCFRGLCGVHTRFIIVQFFQGQFYEKQMFRETLRNT